MCYPQIFYVLIVIINKNNNLIFIITSYKLVKNFLNLRKIFAQPER